MTCVLCADKLERGLRRVPGVAAATVNYGSDAAIVTHEGAEAGSIERAIRSAGFAADPGDGSAVRRHRRDTLARLVAAAIVSAPLLLSLFVCAVDECCIVIDPAAQSSFSLFMSEARFRLGFLRDWRLQAALASIVLIVAGSRIFRNAFYSLRSGRWGMDLLVALSSSISYGFSLYLGVHSGRESTTHYYFETAAIIIALVLLGKFLEFRARSRAGSAVSALLGLRSRTAVLREGEVERVVPTDSLASGDLIVLRPGSRIPADARIVEGRGMADESMLSGESFAALKEPGATVYAGTVNGEGLLLARVEKTGDDTALAAIIALVEGAQASKTRIQGIADKICSYFIPFILLASAATFVSWYFILFKGKIFLIEQPILHALAVLVVSCPCALGLATPAAVSVALATAARRKILIRDGAVLERAYRVSMVVFDKTGTLTRGEMRLEEALPRQGGYGSGELLALAAAAESPSRHPIGRSFDAARFASGEDALAVSGFHEIPGRGVIALAGGHSVTVGSRAFLEEIGAATSPLPSERPAFLSAHVAVDGRYEGSFFFAEAIAEGAAAAVSRISARGIRTVLLSGDGEEATRRVALESGVDLEVSGALPERKLRIIREFKGSGEVVMMVGDGVNDAPALAAADIGVAIGSGTEVAVQAGSVVLLGSDLSGLDWLIGYSRRVTRTIKANLFWCFGYNLIAIPLAALGLLRPEIACLAMTASSLIVILNSLRLGRGRAHD
jgi:P-type Cu+ transporter